MLFSKLKDIKKCLCLLTSMKKYTEILDFDVTSETFSMQETCLC